MGEWERGEWEMGEWESGRVGEWESGRVGEGRGESGRVGEKAEGEGKRLDLQLKGQQVYTAMSLAISPCVGPGKGID